MDNLQIKKATLDDSRDVWSWRNDDTTRRMSITTDEISWESHNNWFEKSLLSMDKFLYVGLLESDGTKVGICRFDIDSNEDIAEVSMNLNPNKRGQGLSSKFLSEAIRSFFKERQIDLVAAIKKQNVASIKCFTKCGFVFDSEDSAYNHYIFHRSEQGRRLDLGNAGSA